MTRKPQLINEIADLIVERLDERSRLDELSPGYLKGMQDKIQDKIQDGEYDIRGQVINSKIEQHYTVWLEREVLEPIARIVQSRLQTISSENVSVKVSKTVFYKSNRGRGSLFDCLFTVSKGDETERFTILFRATENGFYQSWATNLARGVDIVITHLFREKTKRNFDIPLTRDERAVVDRILILTSKLVNKPDIVNGAKALSY